MSKITPPVGYGRQWIDEADREAVLAVLSGDMLTQGPAVEAFERTVAKYVNAKHAIAVSSGTAALHIACMAADLGPGDIAAVPTLTFVATANAARYCGAEAAVLDVDRESLSLTAAQLGPFLQNNPHAKAVLPVHFAGLSAGLAELRKVAGERIIIEDACHALGGRYEDGQMIGSCAHSDMAVFSFHPVKPITTGEGGMITTNDDELARKLKMFRSHGIERDPARFVGALKDELGPWGYEQQTLGFNYRLSDLQAALGTSRMSKLDGFLERRRAIAAYYDDRFSGLEHVSSVQHDPASRVRSGHHLYVVEVDFAALGTTRTDVMAQLRDLGVGTQVHYIPVHRQPYHQASGDLQTQDFPNAESYYAGALTLPFFPAMTDDNMRDVADNICAVLGAP